jgi:hypothetical protein
MNNFDRLRFEIKDTRIAELEQWKKNACERMEGLSTAIDGYVERIAELENTNQGLGFENLDMGRKIAELEKEVKQYKVVENWVRSFTIDELEAHNLEQQAKGCDDGGKAASISLGGDAVVIGETELNDYANDLRKQAKALKEQVK